MKSSMNHEISNSNDWLGFSLLPHFKMEVSASSSTSSVPTNYVMSSTHHNYSPFCYGAVGGENGGDFHYSGAPLSGIPLKSDGSLCIMEAFSRSQTQGT